MKFSEWLVGTLDRGENGVVAIISKIVPLLVPIIPAYVGYRHVTNPKLLNFDPFFGWVYAAVIEGLGYAAVYKAVQFWEYNKTSQAKREVRLVAMSSKDRMLQRARNKITEKQTRAPLGVAIGIYVVYLIVTLAVNVVLDIYTGVVWYNILAIGLISFLSFPAGLLMSISAIHAQRTSGTQTSGTSTSETSTSGTTSGTKTSGTKLLKVTSRTRTSRTQTSRTTNGNGTSRTAPQPMGFDTSESKMGRPSIHEGRVFRYMDQVWNERGEAASFTEVQEELKLPQSTTSRLRKLWVERNGK